MTALLAPATAGALDLREIGADLSSTPARIEQLKSWEVSKINGARTARELSDPNGHPEYVRIGNFFVINDVTSRLVYDTNVHATANGARGDVRWETSPLIVVRSDFKRHILDFQLSGRIARYRRETALDHDDARGVATGVFHLDHAHALSLKAGSELTHEDRLAIGAATNATSLTPIVHSFAHIGLKRDAGRLYASTGASFDDWRYGDVRDATGTPITQGHRDVAQTAADLKVGYRFSPGFELLGRLKGLRQENRGNAQVDTTAWGGEAVAGVRFEMGTLVRGWINGGYGIRDYDRADYATAGIGLIEGGLDWLIAPSLTASLSISRSFDDGVSSSTTTGGSGGRVQQIIGARVDYWFSRNLLFTLGADYRQTVFQDESRTDTLLRSRAGLEQHLGRNLRLTLGVEHVEQQSTLPEFDVTRSTISAGALVRF